MPKDLTLEKAARNIYLKQYLPESIGKGFHRFAVFSFDMPQYLKPIPQVFKARVFCQFSRTRVDKQCQRYLCITYVLSYVYRQA